MATEIVLFSDPTGIHITNARASLGGTTYAMAGVTSVTMARTRASRRFGWFALVIGILAFTIALGEKSSGAFVAALFWLGVAWAGIKLPRDRYHVRLGSASGEQEALTSTDRNKIQAIVDALNDAIVRRA